jgi:hypothetical protein
MKLKLTVLFIVFALFMFTGSNVFARRNSSSDLLKQGLLGAGAGAAGSAMSGGNAGTGALVGAGVNVLGGALLDSITDDGRDDYDSSPPRRVYEQAPVQQQAGGSYSQGYEDGYSNGYKKGYTDGYKDGLKEGVKN